jgi:hypothetical protein
MIDGQIGKPRVGSMPPFPGIGSISATIHMLAKGPDIARSNDLMRVLGTVLLSMLVCLKAN